MSDSGDRFDDSEAFYTPSPSDFGHKDAFRLYTGYAARLKEAGLADRFPADAELRHITIELLAEREAVEDVAADPVLINDAVAEAREILREQRNR